MEATDFRLERGLPVWTLAAGTSRVEKRAVMPHGSNTVALVYRLLSGEEPMAFEIALTVAFRRLEDPVSRPLDAFTLRTVGDGQYEMHGSAQFPPLRLWCAGATLASGSAHVATHWYATEASRGYDASGQLWCPGVVHVALERSKPCLVVATTEDWGTIRFLTADGVVSAEEERRAALTRKAAGRGIDRACPALLAASTCARSAGACC